MEEILNKFQISYDKDGYCKSFQLSDFEKYQGQDNIDLNPMAFFKHFGFLVIDNVLTKEDCDKTVSEVFDIIESKSRFKRNDISTWGDFPIDNAIPQYGSPSKPPIFKTQFLHNRTNPNVYKLFSTLLNNNDLLVNHDRCCFFRPTKDVKMLDGSIVSKPEWATKTNLHLDMNPWAWMGNGDECRKVLDGLRYGSVGEFIQENNQPCQGDGLQLQGVLNLMDNKIEDGGYIVVPGFNNIFQDYFTNVKKGSQGPIDTKKDSSYNFNSREVPYKYYKRISMRQGSCVVWDQKMPHGSAKNESSRPRMAQFIKLFPTSTCSKERLVSRSNVIKHNIKFNVKPEFPLNEISTQLLGLK